MTNIDIFFAGRSTGLIGRSVLFAWLACCLHSTAYSQQTFRSQDGRRAWISDGPQPAYSSKRNACDAMGRCDGGPGKQMPWPAPPTQPPSGPLQPPQATPVPDDHKDGVSPHRDSTQPRTQPRDNGSPPVVAEEVPPGAGESPDSRISEEFADQVADAESDPSDQGFDGASDSFDANSLLDGGTSFAAAISVIPHVTGDLFGGGVSSVSGVETFSQAFSAPGFILNGQPAGSSNALLGFDAGSGVPTDILTTGIGADTTGDGFANQFNLLEPIPPSAAPLPPGAGFLFQNGTAVFAGPGAFNSGDTFDLSYNFERSFGVGGAEPIRLAGPDVATRRVKLAENFSPEVVDRCYLNYSYFNNAFGGLGDVNRWVLGMERVLIDDLASLEVRLPMATTRSGRQQIDAPGARGYELGNATAIGKLVMLSDDHFIWTAGMGVTMPLARDSRLLRGNQTLLRIRNDQIHLLPFTGLFRRINRDTSVQGYVQLDVDTNGNRISGDLSGAGLPRLGRLRDSTLLHLDFAIHRTIVQPSPHHTVRQVIANAELHYTGSLEKARSVRGNGLTITDLANRFDIVNATFSSHWMLGRNWVVTPGISVPLTGGTNRQFNYEALVQVNYLR